MGASPSDRANLAPVDLGSRVWTPYLRRVFRSQDQEAARGTGVAGDMSVSLGVGYYNLAGQRLRGSVAENEYAQGKRGHMPVLPTPQALIRMISGIGEPPQGR